MGYREATIGLPDVREQFYWHDNRGWRQVEFVRAIYVGHCCVRDVCTGEYHDVAFDELQPMPAPGVLDNVK